MIDLKGFKPYAEMPEHCFDGRPVLVLITNKKGTELYPALVKNEDGKWESSGYPLFDADMSWGLCSWARILLYKEIEIPSLLDLFQERPPEDLPF